MGETPGLSPEMVEEVEGRLGMQGIRGKLTIGGEFDGGRDWGKSSWRLEWRKGAARVWGEGPTGFKRRSGARA